MEYPSTALHPFILALQLHGSFPYRYVGSQDGRHSCLSAFLLLWCVFLKTATGVLVLILPEVTRKTWPSGNVGAQSSIVGASISELIMAFSPTILLWNSTRLNELLLQLSKAMEDFYHFVPCPKLSCTKDYHSVLVIVLNALLILFKAIYFYKFLTLTMFAQITLLGVIVFFGEITCIITFKMVIRVLAEYLEDAAKVFIKSCPYEGSSMTSVEHKVNLDDVLHALEMHVRKIEDLRIATANCFGSTMTAYLIGNALQLIIIVYSLMNDGWSWFMSSYFIVLTSLITHICKTGQYFTNKVKRTMAILKKGVTPIRDPEVKTKVFHLLVSLEAVSQFDINSYYELGNHTICSICGLVVSYLVILLQIGGQPVVRLPV